MTVQTEVDALADQNGPGTHVAFTNLVDLSHPVPGLKDVTAYAKSWSHFGLNRGAPDAQVYSGVAQRF